MKILNINKDLAFEIYKDMLFLNSTGLHINRLGRNKINSKKPNQFKDPLKVLDKATSIDFIVGSKVILYRGDDEK